MGTSKSFPGAKTPEWARAKARATKWGSLGGGDAGAGVAGVVAGAAQALAASGPLLGSAGISGAQRLGEVLAGLSDEGVDDTLTSLGLEGLVGEPGLDVVAGLLEYVAESGDDLDEAAMQEAARQILDELAEIDALQTGAVVDRELANALFIKFFAHYLAAKILLPLSETLINRLNGPEVVRLEGEIRDYVFAMLEARLVDRAVFDIDWSGAEGAVVATEIGSEVLSVFLPDEEP